MQFNTVCRAEICQHDLAHIPGKLSKKYDYTTTVGFVLEHEPKTVVFLEKPYKNKSFRQFSNSVHCS